MEPIAASGIDGQLQFDGTTVSITRKGFTARSMRGMSGTKSIPVTSITAVQFRPATSMVNGFVTFSVQGELPTGKGRSGAQKDENGVLFRKSHMKEMQPLVDAVQAAIASGRAPAPVAQPDPMEQLKKLGELHSAGLLSDGEFEAKRQELIGRI